MSLKVARELRLAGRHADALALLQTLGTTGEVNELREHFFNYFALRQFDQLFQVGEEVRRADSRFTVDVLSHYGLLLREAGEPAKAVEHFVAARKFSSDSSNGQLPEWFYSELSGTLFSLKWWPEALEAARAGVTGKPALHLTVAAAHIKLGDIPSARLSARSAVTALSLDASKAKSLLSICSEIWTLDSSDESWRLLLDAQIAFPHDGKPNLVRGAVAFSSGDFADAAREWLETLIESKPLRVPLLHRIAEEVQKRPELHLAFCELHEGLVLADSENSAVVFSYYEYLLLRFSHADAIVKLIAFQTRALRLLPSLLVELVRWGCALEQLRVSFRTHIDAWQRTSTFRDCNHFFVEMCNFRPIDAAISERIQRLGHSLLQLFILLRNPEQQAIRISEATDSNIAVLQDSGIGPEALRECMTTITQMDSLYAQYLRDAAVSCPEALDQILGEEIFVAFQDKVVRDRQFQLVDPLTGCQAELFDSVKIFDRQVFSFAGKELFFFISGGNMNAGAFIASPGCNLLFPIERGKWRCSQNYFGSIIHMADLFAVYLARAARKYSDFLSAAAEAPKRAGLERKIIAVHGRAENPAHHSWNYLSPFNRLARAGLLGNLAAVVRPPTEYFGPIEKLFPELRHCELLNHADTSAIDPTPFSVAHIVIQLGGNFITKALKQRISRWAQNELSLEQVDSIRCRAQLGQPVVWIGLRTGDKVWTNQQTGVIGVIDRIVARHPNATFLLDGFSLPRLNDAIPQKWNLQVETLREIAVQIKLNCSRPDSVINMVGNTLAESLVWAAHTTVYLTPLGSSQHKVGWYTDCPGVVYTSEKFAIRPPALRPGAWESEGSAVPEFIIGKLAGKGKRRDHFDFRINLENLDISEDDVANKLLEMIKIVEVRRDSKRIAAAP